MISFNKVTTGLLIAATIGLSTTMVFAAAKTHSTSISMVNAGTVNLSPSTLPEEIIIGRSAAVLPTWDAHGNRVVLFHVVNPSSSLVTFSVPTLGIENDVPAGADRTFYIDMTRVSGASITYNVRL